MTIFKLIGCIVLLAIFGCSGGAGDGSKLGTVFPAGTTTPPSTTTPPPTTGKTPTGVTATAVGSVVNLSWTPVLNAISYNIYGGRATGVSKTNRATYKIINSTYQDTNLVIGNTYYYVVSANFSTYDEGPVSTEVSAKNNNFVREVEPNNETTTATSITIGGDALRGQLSSDTEADYYSFTSVAGVVTFSIKPDESVNSVSGSGHIKATVLGSDGINILSSTDEIDGSDSSYAENCSGFSPQTYSLSANLAAGKYYLKMETPSGFTSFRKDYVISSGYNSSMSREFEPNNNTATATQLANVGGTIYGQLSSNTDVDYYKFTSTGNIVSFKIKADSILYSSTGTIKATILASDGTTVFSSIDNISGRNVLSGNETVEYTLSSNLATGTYYLKMETPSGFTSFRKDYAIAY
ncbi:MAG: hypothetical protein ACOYL3_06370 [Desulfuromonadaceae bacterium]